MRIIVFTALFLISAFALHAQRKVSVIYCGIGSDIYTVFGHTGIRISNGTSDVVYNFGTFDPSTPHFISKYIKGNLDYSLSVQDYNQFISSYIEEGREITEHQLSLTSQEIINIEAELATIYNSKSKYYRYQFLKNNCSTKIFEVIQQTLSKRLIQHKVNLKSTYRQSLNEILKYNSFLRLPVNCLLGRMGENHLNSVSKVYLPDSLISELQSSRVLSESSQNTALVISREVKFQSTNNLKVTYTDFIITALFLLVIIVFRSKYILLFTASLGAVIIFLMVFSLRQEFAYNYNVFLFNPIDFLVVFSLERYRKQILICSLFFNMLYVVVFCFVGINYLPLMIINLGIVYLKSRMLVNINNK
ncbi:DUF4105 domain-containing protein [Pedobacter sp. B4-66]|uniref:lipoprotein N-acyltransferase Lnb domain-containing protein n=1 Tax=Pedobacter sp. B4-66 TaxID=2817280 RepID=UPI001BDA4CAF|nr:DUF4105 domain-containing protein [Pedobacter sp. B4-66]